MKFTKKCIFASALLNLILYEIFVIPNMIQVHKQGYYQIFDMAPYYGNEAYLECLYDVSGLYFYGIGLWLCVVTILLWIAYVYEVKQEQKRIDKLNQ